MEKSLSRSAARRAGKASKPRLRKSPLMRWRCRWIASLASLTGRLTSSGRARIVSFVRRRDGRVGDIADRGELQSGASRCRLGREPGEIELLEGRIAQASNGRSITLAKLATEGLTAEESFANNRHTYSYGAHAAHVAVDPDTGHVELIDYVAVEDVGRIINPDDASRSDRGRSGAGSLAEHCSSTWLMTRRGSC